MKRILSLAAGVVVVCFAQEGHIRYEQTTDEEHQEIRQFQHRIQEVDPEINLTEEEVYEAAQSIDEHKKPKDQRQRQAMKDVIKATRGEGKEAASHPGRYAHDRAEWKRMKQEQQIEDHP